MPDAAGLCLPFSPCVSQSLRSYATCCDAGSGSCLPLQMLRRWLRVVSPACLPVSCQTPMLGRWLCRGRVSRLSPYVSQSLRSDVRCCDAGSGVVSPASQSLRSDARCCDVSPAGLPVSPSLCGHMPHAVTLAPGSCLPLQMLRRWLRVVSPACLPVSGCQMLRRCLRGCVSRFLCVSPISRFL